MYEYSAHYIRTIDGDTIDANVDLGFHISIVVRVRLSVIDTPEKGQAGWTEATNYTRAWFEKHPDFTLRTEHDKSGGFDRWLGDCSFEGESLNKLLLDNGLAKVYHR